MFKLSKETYNKKKWEYRSTYIGSRMFFGECLAFVAFIFFLLWTGYSLLMLETYEIGKIVPMAVMTGFGSLLSMAAYILLAETDFKLFKEYVEHK